MKINICQILVIPDNVKAPLFSMVMHMFAYILSLLKIMLDN